MKDIITLTKNYPNWESRITNIQLILIVLILIFMTTILLSWDSLFVIVIVPVLTILLIFKMNKYLKKIKDRVRKKFYWQNKLLYFIQSNSLYKEDYEIYVDENNKERKRVYIASSAVFSYEITGDKIIIYALKKGDSYSDRLTKLDVELSALIKTDLEEKINRNSVCEYHYFLKRPERLNVISTEIVEVNESLNINLGYGVVYEPVKTPHILIAGGTGSGKSIFISYLLLEFLKQNSSIFVIDPKNSDLGSLSHYLGNERVATTPNNIARVVRLAVTEMKERYDYMNENFKYGSNFSYHGYKPIWVIFDEMGAFQASGTDKQSKTVVSEVMDGIKQVILLGRQAGVFILIAAQQMRSETLSTDLRDNLGLRISLGSNSAEGYRMVFGSATPETIPPIEVKGSGLLYMQGSGKESAQYWESPFIDMQNFDFITELKKYC